MMEESKIIDISMTLQKDMTTYPGDVPYQRSLQRDMGRGDSSNVSVMLSSAHTGTHLDAPCHYFPHGYGADKIPLEQLYGAAYVADCRGVRVVTADELQNKVPPQTTRLLIKTDNSQLLYENPRGNFNKDFIYLSADAAEFIVKRNIILVGIDYLSIDKSGIPEKPAHHILLSHNITIMEGVVLAHVEQGSYFLACGCLKMADSDGSPCRAVLIKE